MTKFKESGLVGKAEALENPNRHVKRLLIMAVTWPDESPGEVVAPAEIRLARQLRPAEVDELVNSHHAGRTLKELAAQFGVHRATIGKHLADRGIDTRAPVLGPDKLQHAAELYRQGATLADIAKRYRIGPETARTHLVAAGVWSCGRGGDALVDVCQQRKCGSALAA